MADHWENVKPFRARASMRFRRVYMVDEVDAALAAERSDSQARITALEQENATQAKRIDKLRARVRGRGEEITHLEQAIDTNVETIKMMQAQRDEARSECASLRSQLSAQTQEMENWKGAYEAMERVDLKTRGKVEALTRERDALKEALEKAHGQIMNLKGEVEEDWSGSEKGTYRIGHRDARHAAAELVSGISAECSTTGNGQSADLGTDTSRNGVDGIERGQEKNTSTFTSTLPTPE